jgi:ABC-type multidrug transport system ATPase subunit
LLDEPFASGMDPNGISFLKREAQNAARQGRTVIYSTQILDIAEKVSDRVCVIDKGEVRHYAMVSELQRTNPGEAACWRTYSKSFGRDNGEAQVREARENNQTRC